MAVASIRFTTTRPHPNGYEQSDYCVEITDELGPVGCWHGEARRTGITPPDYPDRAVYEIFLSRGNKAPMPRGLFILDNDEFVPREEWYKRQCQL